MTVGDPRQVTVQDVINVLMKMPATDKLNVLRIRGERLVIIPSEQSKDIEAAILRLEVLK